MAASNKCTLSVGSLARSRNEYRLSLPDASPLNGLPMVLRNAAYFGTPFASLPTKTALWYYAICDTLLNERKVNATPEKIICHSVCVGIFLWQKQHLRLVFLYRRERRLPLRRNACEGFDSFHKAVLPDLDEIIEGGNAADTS